MEDAPGLWEVLSRTSFDLFWASLIVAAGVLYFRGVLRAESLPLRVPHSPWRVAAFAAALVLVALAVMSPIHSYGNELLWVNFTGFLFLTMLAPPLFVLSAPLTLAFRVSSQQRRARLRSLYRSRVVSFVTFPVAIWLLFAAITYIWQLTELTEIAARNWWVRDIQEFTLLLVGLCFWYEGLQIDPVRWRMAHPMRILFIGVEMVHKGLFGAMFLSMSRPFHQQFAASLPAWAPSPMMDQRLGILILWIGGNLIFLCAIIGLIAGWLRYEQRNQHRIDRRLEQARAVERERRAALDQVFSKSL